VSGLFVLDALRSHLSYATMLGVSGMLVYVNIAEVHVLGLEKLAVF